MKEKSKLQKYSPIRVHLNITFTKLVFTYIIWVGIQTQDNELVKIGALGFVGRKIGSSIIDYLVNK
jgi:hypothetical protein